MTEQSDPTQLIDMDEFIALQEGEPIHLTRMGEGEGEQSYRILPLQRTVIGRAENATIRLEGPGISRHHTLIEHADGQPRIVDLGSTNGTFVNGQRTDAAVLATGDRIQIGSAVFEVTIGKPPVQGGPVREGTDPEIRQNIKKVRETLEEAPSGSDVMMLQQTILSGQLEKIGITSLLQTLEVNRNSGSLLVHVGDQIGQIVLKKGQPIHAVLGRTQGLKALFRLIGVEEGRFEFVTPGREPTHPTIDRELEGLLLEAVTEIDDFSQYRPELPPDDAVLVFAPNRYFILSRMPADLFDVLACIARHRTVGAVIDECELSDLNICRHLLMLLNEGIVTVEE